jgi:hypothetical protein
VVRSGQRRLSYGFSIGFRVRTALGKAWSSSTAAAWQGAGGAVVIAIDAETLG